MDYLDGILTTYLGLDLSQPLEHDAKNGGVDGEGTGKVWKTGKHGFDLWQR